MPLYPSKSGKPLVLAQSAVAAVLTGTTTPTDLGSILIPGGTMGPNDSLRINYSFSYNTNNANNKQMVLRFGSAVLNTSTRTNTGGADSFTVRIKNRGVTNSQATSLLSEQSTTSLVSSAVLATAVDMSVDQALRLQGILTNAADTITLESFSVELLSNGSTTTIFPIQQQNRAINTWANRPTNPASGDRFFATDLNREMVYDGGVWGFVGNKPFAQSAVPVGIPSSGTIGNNGALSGVAAMPTGMLVPGAYLYFPAGAIVAGSAAGFYWTVMSSATAGTIYNNTYSGIGDPVIPATPTPFVTTGPGAYTQSSGEITLRSIMIPGGLMGSHGGIRFTPILSYANSTNAKNYRVRFAGTIVVATSPSTTIAMQPFLVWRNRGSANRQVTFNSMSAPYAQTTAGNNYSAIDTSVDFPCSITGQLTAGAEATDFMFLDANTLEVMPA